MKRKVACWQNLEHKHSIFQKTSGYFQLHETSLLDALHWGDMIPP